MVGASAFDWIFFCLGRVMGLELELNAASARAVRNGHTSTKLGCRKLICQVTRNAGNPC
jgi:hypothetical protein